MRLHHVKRIQDVNKFEKVLLNGRSFLLYLSFVKAALTEAAHSVGASKNYLGAMYRRTLAKKGRKRAAIVVAHAMLRIAYYLLIRKEMYVDLGDSFIIDYNRYVLKLNSDVSPLNYLTLRMLYWNRIYGE